MSLADLRDVVVIVYGGMGILLMLALAIAAFGLWFAVRALSRQLRDLLDDPVRPTLEEVRRTAENVRGTSEFIADTAVHPIIRTVAMVRGVRRGVSAVTGLRRRGK
jgi:divalent metal cation (Fe/Co/Zn/Cd) transporter